MASEEEYSDLTELETDDDEKFTNTKKKTKSGSGKGKDVGGYKIKNALKVPRATTYTAQALHDQIYAGDINLEPEYQRDVVWSETKQIGIIDSVFRNFYIPPIIFAVNTFEDGAEHKTCIDGKQRLTSIHRFMDGLIPHRDPLTNEKLWYKDVPTGTSKAAKTRRLLPEKYQRLFANKQIVCVEYQGITDGDEREIFQRVQLGMALTPAEKLQVIKTPRADFIRELQNSYMKEDGWLSNGTLEWDTSRGSDFRGLAQAVYYMDKYSTAKVPLSTMTQLEKWLGLGEPFSASFHSKVEDSYQIFAEMVQDKTFCRVFKKPVKVSPIEFILIGVFIFAHKDKASVAQLSAGIAHLRDDVRKVHTDIRINTRVSKTLIEFIQRWDPNSNKIPGDIGGPASNTTNSTGVKRKRAVSKNESNDDDEVDELEDDDDAPKPKKKALAKNAPSLPTPNSMPALPPQTQSTQAAPPTSTPLPGTDRMAALRRAKETIAQRQAQRQAQIPTGPRALAVAAGNDSMPNPQMLPSPGPTHSFPSAIVPAQSQASSINAPNLPIPSPSMSAPTSIDTSVMATMMRGTNPNNEPRPVPPPSSRTAGLPPPPFSGGSLSSADGSHRGADRERDRDRDWDRGYHGRGYDERDRDRDRGRDRGRYDPSRRDSGYSNGPRSPDELGRPRTTSVRRDPPR